MRFRISTRLLSAFAFFLILASCSSRPYLAPPAVPPNLVPPEGEVLLRALASGVQVYVCRPSAGDPAKFEWAFKTAHADLYNEQGERIGAHYGGATWEKNDGSKVVAELKEDADSLDPSAVAWSLFKAKSTEGNGALSKVTYIQRVDTAGGKASTKGCGKKQEGLEVSVDYTATYYFYGPQR